MTSLAVSLLLAGAGLGASCRADGVRTVSVTEAEAGLRSSDAFTVRADSSGRRELVRVAAIRRLGRGVAEVEFVWRDAAVPGRPAGPERESMALFRLRDNMTWGLSSLYKVE